MRKDLHQNCPHCRVSSPGRSSSPLWGDRPFRTPVAGNTLKRLGYYSSFVHPVPVPLSRKQACWELALFLGAWQGPSLSLRSSLFFPGFKAWGRCPLTCPRALSAASSHDTVIPLTAALGPFVGGVKLEEVRPHRCLCLTPGRILGC